MLIPRPGLTRRHHTYKPWRIIKSKHDPAYPWLVSRREDDGRYVPFTRCASHAAAIRLLDVVLQAMPSKPEYKTCRWVSSLSGKAFTYDD